MHGQVCWLLRGRACHRRRCDSSPASRVCHQRACLPASSLSCLPGDPARGWSDEFSFRTAPLVGPEALPYRLGLVLAIVLGLLAGAAVARRGEARR